MIKRVLLRSRQGVHLLALGYREAVGPHFVPLHGVYADGSENQLWQTDVAEWSPDLEPELRRQHAETTELMEAMRATVRRAEDLANSTREN